MKVVRVVTKTVEAIEVEDIRCNQCGLSCATDPEMPRNFYGLIEATVSGGYSSPELIDRGYYIFSLCEKCLKGQFDNFKIPPVVFHEGAQIPYSPNWKTESQDRKRSDQEILDRIEPYLPAVTPKGWKRRAEGNRWHYVWDTKSRLGTQVAFCEAANTLLVVIGRANSGEISRKDLAEAHRLFVPWVSLNGKSRGVHIERSESRGIRYATFQREFRDIR